MTVYGFCLTEQTDVEASTDRRCLTDGALVIPPTHGDHLQTWVDGAWMPEIARPDGYVYRPKYAPLIVAETAEPTEPISEARDCAYCGKPFTQYTRLSKQQLYCAVICKERAAGVRARAKKVERKRLAATQPAPVRPCQHCGTVFTPASRQVFCADACRKRSDRARAKLQMAS